MRADRVLAILGDLYERAVQPWEKFRTVQPPERFMLICCTGDVTQDAEAAPIYDRWPYGTFPPEIQRDARFRYWELKTTTRFSLDDTPDKWSLEQVHPATKPLDFRHVAGIAAIVCISEALEHYEETLSEWAVVVHRHSPGLSFKWLAQCDPGRLEMILAAYLTSTEGDKGRARAREMQAAMLVKNAEGWLALADLDDSHQAEIERATLRAKAQAEMHTLAQVKAEISSRNSAIAKGPRGNAKTLTPQAVADYFNARPGEKQEILAAEMAAIFGVGERTITRRLAEARKGNLLS